MHESSCGLASSIETAWQPVIRGLAKAEREESHESAGAVRERSIAAHRRRYPAVLPALACSESGPVGICSTERSKPAGSFPPIYTPGPFGGCEPSRHLGLHGYAFPRTCSNTQF